MKALVIGYGSIGSRHARILAELGCRTSVVSRRIIDFPIAYSNIEEALSAERPYLVVIANETAEHHSTFEQLVSLNFAGIVLVEKPLFDEIRDVRNTPFSSVLVAYNLRFHPVIQRVRQLLGSEIILSVQAYVGHYLPEWRPAVDYRQSYSARVNMGGGALRDISHELDYLLWMLNGWKGVAAIGGHFSQLEIDSDDIFSLMLDTQACQVVSLQMNYLDRVGRRFVLINTAQHTIFFDLVKGEVTVDGETECFAVERDLTYREMHKAILSGDSGDTCTLSEGLEVMRLIAATELASDTRKWVSR